MSCGLLFQGERVTAGDLTKGRMRTKSSRNSPWGTPLFISQDPRCRDWSIIAFENVPIELQLGSKSKYERSGTNSQFSLNTPTPPYI